MSDVIWAAAIAGGVGLAGNVTTYFATKRQAATAMAAAGSQAEVELAKVEAENERLRAQHREAERQNRQGTYHRLLAVLDRFDMIATGFPVQDDSFEQALFEFNTLIGGVHLFGDDGVRDALGPLVKLFEHVGASGPASMAERFRDGYRDRRAAIIAATSDLTDAMRRDVLAT